jgi:hypothetical protein
MMTNGAAVSSVKKVLRVPSSVASASSPAGCGPCGKHAVALVDRGAVNRLGEMTFAGAGGLGRGHLKEADHRLSKIDALRSSLAETRTSTGWTARECRPILLTGIAASRSHGLVSACLSEWLHTWWPLDNWPSNSPVSATRRFRHATSWSPMRHGPELVTSSCAWERREELLSDGSTCDA